jgi:magnesium chelatase family protein
MFTTVRSFCLDGISARPVRVEVDVHRGLPSFAIVGLPDSAVRDARERIRAALVNSGFDFPLRRVVVNLAPGSLRRSAPAFDLPIAAALLAASGQIELGRLKDVGFVGELSLDGSLRPVPGALAATEEAKRFGAATIVVPSANGAESALVEDIDIVALNHLSQLPALCSGKVSPAAPVPLALGLETPAGSPDMAELREQPELRRALEVAAAGGHSMLMVGPRGSGRAMAASRLPSILPPLLPAQALEVARIASAAGRLGPGGWIGGRPFRAPHHTISAAGLMGGGIPPRPGMVTLAHRGVLFLDQVEEFRRDALEALRAPLDHGEVVVSRGGSRRSFPARFQLLAAADPCPCGRGTGDPDCPCAPHELQRYRGLIDGAICGQVEISISVREPSAAEIGSPPGESSAAVADRVCRARELQERRLGPGRCNAEMTPKESGSCALHSDAVLLLGELTASGRLGDRAQEIALCLAQTLSDLDEAAHLITEEHLTEALRHLPA